MLFALCLLFALPAFAARIVDESFEGTGYEESWTEIVGSGNTLNEDYFLAEDTNSDLPPGSASECLRLVMAGNSNDTYTQRTFGNSTIANVSTTFNPKSVSWSTPASGDNINLWVIYNSTNGATARLQVYYNGSNYQLRYGYWSGGAMLFTTGYTISTTQNTFYRIETKYDGSANKYRFQIYNMSGSLLHDIPSGADGDMTSPRVPNYMRAGCIGTDATTAEIHFESIRIDNSSFPIGANSEFSTIDSDTFNPNLDGFLSEWTPIPPGTHYTTVNDSDDGTYIYTNNNPSVATDLWEVGDPNPDTDTLKRILAIRVWARAKRYSTVNDAQDNAFQIVLRTGGVIYTHNNNPVIPVITTGTSFLENYAELELNPNTGLPWTWDDIENLQIGVRLGANRYVTVAKAWLEILHGSHKHRYPTASPSFPGANTSTISVRARSIRPAYFADKTSYLKVRYKSDSNCSTVNMGSGYSETSSQQVSSLSDWNHTFNISSLSTNTKYCFDIYVSPDDSTNWISLHDQFSMSYYPEAQTFPTEDVDANIDIALMNDPHYPTSSQALASLVAKSPRIVICGGDLISPDQTASPSNLSDITTGRTLYRIMFGMKSMLENIWHKYVVISQWDDHDFFANDARENSAEKESSFKAFMEYRPPLSFPSTCKLTGTTTGTSAGKLINSGANFTVNTVHALATYGGAFVLNTTDGTYTAVTAIDSTTQLSLDDDIFTSGESYEIYNGMWRSFKIANAEIFLPDLRYMSDPPGTDADMMDGTGDGGGTGNGHIQRSWFLSAIENSTAKWKVVVTEVTWNRSARASSLGEGWGDYDKANDALRTYIWNNFSDSTRNLFYLSSNRHYGGLQIRDNNTKNFNEMCAASFSWSMHQSVSLESGTCTSGTSGTNLEDTGQDFLTTLYPDVAIKNLTQAANWSTISSVVNNANLTMDHSGKFANGDSFDAGEFWSEMADYNPYSTKNIFGIIKIRADYIRLEIYDEDGTLVDYLQLGSETLMEITDTMNLSDSLFRDKSFALADSINFSDSILNNKSFPISDSIGISDTVLRDKLHQIMDTLILADSILTNKTIITADSFGMADSALADKQMIISDALSIFDNILRNKTLTISDLIDIADAVEVAKYIFKEINDSISLTDAILANKNLTLADNIDLVDSILRNKALTLSDLMNMSDSQFVDKGLFINDSISISDMTLIHKQLLIIQENLQLLDQIVRDKQISLADSMNLSDSILTDKLLQVSELIQLTESILANKTFSLADAINMTDFVYRHKYFSLNDSLSMLDSIYRNKSFSIQDEISMADSVYKDKILVILETVGLIDSILTNKNLTITDLTTLADSVERIGETLKEILDTMGISDSAKINKSMTVSDLIGIIDSVLANKTLTILDQVILTDISIALKTLVISDSIDILDTVLRDKTFAVVETVQMIESILANKSFTVNDLIALADSVEKIGEIIKEVLDTMSISDAVLANKNITIPDIIALVDSILVHKILNISDQAAISDAVATLKLFVISDQVAITDEVEVAKNIIKEILDSISMTDAVQTHKILNIADTMALQEIASTVVKELIITDQISIVDLVLALKVMVITEQLSLTDAVNIIDQTIRILKATINLKVPSSGVTIKKPSATVRIK
jgi:hypothetical protein